MKMNLPNRLTILRVLLIPVFILFLLLDIGKIGDEVAVVIFILAALTDLADGKIARKYNMVTNFGKFMDPLADKLLVCSAAICLAGMDRIPSWVVVVLVGREFVISGFRLIAAENGIVIAASMWGKIKTTVQMIMTVILIVHFENPFWHVLEQIFIYASLILSLISLCDYIYKNKDILKEQH